MKLDPVTAERTVNYLRRTIPRGQQEADELVKLIKFYEIATSRKASHR